MSKKLMNQGLRTIDEVFEKNSVAIFDDKTAKRLLRLYPNEVVDLDNLKVSYDQNAVKDFTKGKKPAAGSKTAGDETEKSAA